MLKKRGNDEIHPTLQTRHYFIAVLCLYTSQAPLQQGRYRFPESCQTSADCKFLVTYQPSGEEKVIFELSGKGNWAGVGFSDDQLMVIIKTGSWLFDESESLHLGEGLVQNSFN